MPVAPCQVSQLSAGSAFQDCPSAKHITTKESSAHEKPQQREAAQDAAQPEETQLAVLQLQQSQEGAAPAAGRDERKQALEHQDQPQRGPEGVAVQGYFLPAGAATAASPPRKALKKSEPLGSSTITSAFLLKVALYASRLR